MRRVCFSFGVLVVAATWFAWLRPASLGGDVSYVVVDGSSMEPTYRDGDLVLVRSTGTYRHGDVIAFRAGGRFEDPTRIIHRIIGGQGDAGFVTQGDNRDQADPWTPTNDDIIGRAVLHLPMAGMVATRFAQPETMAALGGAAVVVGGGRRRRRRRTAGPNADGDISETQMDLPHTNTDRLRTQTGHTRGKLTGLRRREPGWAMVGLLLCLVLAVPTLAMAWSALRAPDSVDRVEHVGAIDYGIDVGYRFSGPPSAVYPAGEVVGEKTVAGLVEAPGPLYARLLDRVEAEFRFGAGQQGAERTSTTYQVRVVVETPDGWSTELAGADETTFESQASRTVAVDLRTVESQVADIAALTGVGGQSFTIRMIPQLEVDAVGGDTTVADSLTAPVEFIVDGEVITARAADASTTEPLTAEISERGNYTIGPFELRTQMARALTSGLALALVGGIVWFSSVLFGGVGLREPARIAARYRSQMVDVSSASAPPGPVVMVGSIEELARIAKVDQNVMLHEDLGDGAHRYRVFLGAVTYEYESAPEHPGSAAPPELVDGDPER